MVKSMVCMVDNKMDMTNTANDKPMWKKGKKKIPGKDFKLIQVPPWVGLPQFSCADLQPTLE